ncbi:hypothetical protein BS78_08G136700 [Paspalum vaginatum]|nr:hypothetical protein BS78_08G136700 [Paspalum vaginatum]
MHPFALLMTLVAVAGLAGVRGLPAAADTPAARFWEQALPGSPMPEAIAELVQTGIDHSPLKERYAAGAPYLLPSAFCLRYTVNCPPPRGAAESSVPGLFFHEAQLARKGSAMTVAMPPSAVQPILPRDAAARAPFADAAAVLAAFGIPPRSPEAEQVSDTLSECSAPPLAGEQEACATSLEATVGAAARMLGGGPMWAAASALPREGLPLRAYTVAAVSALEGDRHVACHDAPFPYAVFQCHMAATQAPTKAYVVTLSGGGQEVAMAALCHRDTSNWNPAHPAFETLHTKPGGAPVCHFMPYANLLFGVK